MTILTLYYKSRGGGFFKRLCRMISACTEAGHIVYYLAPEPFPGIDNLARVHWHRAPLPGPPELQALVVLGLWPLLVLKVALQSRVNVFAVFGFPYAAVCGLAAKLTRRPIITFVRSDWIAELELAGRWGGTRILGQMVLRVGAWVSDSIVPNSASLGAEISRRLGARRLLRVLPNDMEGGGIPERSLARRELAERCGYREDRFVVGFVGTFKPRKQVSQVIEILGRVRETPSVLVLVGDGADREVVLRRVGELGLRDRVYWLGWHQDVRSFLAGMDLTILPSRFEGSPNAVLESIGVGTPVIGADVMGISDILPEPMRFPLDSVEKAADMVREASTGGDFFSYMARQTKKIRERFSFDWDRQVVEAIANAPHDRQQLGKS